MIICACRMGAPGLFPAKNTRKYPSRIEPANRISHQPTQNAPGKAQRAGRQEPNPGFQKTKQNILGVTCAGSCPTGSRSCWRRRPCRSRRLFLILPCWWMRAVTIKTYDIVRLAPARCLEPHAEIGWFRTGRLYQAPGMPHGRLRIHVGIDVKIPCLFAR